MMKKNLLACLLLIGHLTLMAQGKTWNVAGHWVGTWASAPQSASKSFMPYNNNMTERSVRQVVKVSIGGETLRLQLSNEYSTEPVIIRSVYVANTIDSCDIETASAKYLQFNHRHQVTIQPGKAIMSDALPFQLNPLQRLTITINYAKAPVSPTVHMGSRTTSYVLRGVTNAQTDFSKAFRDNHWYNIAAIDVINETAGAIAIIGNSITDGKNSIDNAQARWTDWLSETLHNKHRQTHQGVLNLGIGANCVVLPGGLGTPAKDRFNRDILDQRGIKKVVIFEGVNDIGMSRGNSELVARHLIEAIEQMIKKARQRRLKVYLGTIMPFQGASYYSPFHEAAREVVNEWIYSQRNKVDGILDFAELLKDPANERRLKKEYQSDWLHPNPAGYQLMGEYAADILKD